MDANSARRSFIEGGNLVSKNNRVGLGREKRQVPDVEAFLALNQGMLFAAPSQKKDYDAERPTIVDDLPAFVKKEVTRAFRNGVPIAALAEELQCKEASLRRMLRNRLGARMYEKLWLKRVIGPPGKPAQS